ncbi:MAG TPA: hypothetical protein VFL81_03185 [Candidatus Saccharimonadales bacterium]|nr:hypothetical protein [Candidatus Saccharimonadales bacterium]
MPKIAWLAKLLSADFPELKFAPGDDFRWSNHSKTVHYIAEDSEEALSNLLHETGHGLLGHQDFKFDIDLLKIERAAWVYARDRLAPRYGLTVDDGLVEDSLDSYRDWLHQRSRCPRCAQTGLENDDKTYTCLNCRTDWRPNEARRCGLKRYIKQI